MSVSVQDTREQSRLVWVLLQIDRRTAGHLNKQTSSVCQPSQHLLCIPTSRSVVRTVLLSSHLTTVLMGCPSLRTHACTSASFSLPFIRPNCSDLLALFPLAKLTIRKFPTCHVCLCYTIMVSVLYISIAFKFEK